MHARALGSALQRKDRPPPERPLGPALEAADTRYVVEVQPITLEDPRTVFHQFRGAKSGARRNHRRCEEPDSEAQQRFQTSHKGNSTEMVKIRLRRVGRKN